MLKDISDIYELAPGNYVNLTVDKLYYTGLDSKNKKSINGHYYYSITDNNCTIFLLSDDSVKKISKKSIPETISNYSIQGIILDDENFNTKLRATFSKQINWSNYELSKMTYPYLISEINTENEIALHLTIILIMMAVIFLVVSIINFVLYFRKKKSVNRKNRF